jgi:aspartate kinase
MVIKEMRLLLQPSKCWELRDREIQLGRMKVLKFGGTSLGNPERMKHVAELVLNRNEQRWVVLSAVSRTTNALYEIVESIQKGDSNRATKQLETLQVFYSEYVNELLEFDENRKEAGKGIDGCINRIKELIFEPYSLGLEKELVAQGEFISTKLFSQLLREKSIDVVLVSALDFMSLNANGEPDMPKIKHNLDDVNKKFSETQVIVTQGFICNDTEGKIDNLKRGGSDFSASIIGACLNSEEIQIWTDIDGMHNNDPRIVNNTRPISKLTFNEAAELAYFGAKILHPSTILPARQYDIPVRIKNTLNPEAEGTIISLAKPGWSDGVKAVAAKDSITAIKIRSSRMLMAYGFLRKVFEVFETYETPIDMITTSEVAVSLTIDNQKHLHEIVSTLEPFGEVEVDYDMSIICVVGNGVAEDKGMVSKIFGCIEDTQVRMISYGGSRNNISILVKSSLKKQTLEGLNNGLFGL